MPRLYREAPLASIWEGSGNVMSLDVLRALTRSPRSLEVFLAEVEQAGGADARLDARVASLKDQFSDPATLESRARRVVEGMALCLQGSLLVRHAPAAVADAFCASRLAATAASSTARCRPAATSRRSSPAAARQSSSARTSAARRAAAARLPLSDGPRTNFQLARIFGIRIGVGVSWFVVLFFLIYWLVAATSTKCSAARRRPPTLVAVAGALGYFASLVLHELGHALVARRLGHPDRRHRPVVLRRPLADARASRRPPARSCRSPPPGPPSRCRCSSLCVLAGTADRQQPAASPTSALDRRRRSAPRPRSRWSAGSPSSTRCCSSSTSSPPSRSTAGGSRAPLIWWRTGDRNRATHGDRPLGAGLRAAARRCSALWAFASGSSRSGC